MQTLAKEDKGVMEKPSPKVPVGILTTLVLV